jgi:hypothetical protein
MEFEVDASVPGVVQAWSTTRLPFEPTGRLANFRRELATACRNLVAEPGQILRATYSSADRSRFDLENVLTYNLGTGAVRAAAIHGLVLERRFTSVQDAPHHYRYELGPEARQWSGWAEGQRLATVRFTAPLSTFSGGKAGAWWLAARRGSDLTVDTPSTTVPDAYLLRLIIDPPTAWRGSLAGLLKPLADGVIAALHTHEGPTETIAQRAGVVDPHLNATEFVHLLTETRAIPLGTVRLVVPWGTTLQWHPADDPIVGLDARITRTGRPGTVTAEITTPAVLEGGPTLNQRSDP